MEPNPLADKALERLLVLGTVRGVYMGLRPIDPGQVELPPGRALSPLERALLGRVGSGEGLDLAFSTRGFEAFLRLSPSRAASIRAKLTVSRGEIYEKAGRSASSRTRPWVKSFRADFNQAYLDLRIGGLRICFGRRGIFWSTARFGALALSDNSPPFDALMLELDLTGGIRLAAFSAMLDEMWNDQRERYLARRFLSAHKASWSPTDRLEIGVGEVVLYGGDVRYPNSGYLNPLIPYYATQFNSNLDDNVMFDFDLSAIPVEGLRVYGELLIDDLQYRGSGPNAVAFTAGFYRAGDPDISLEYTRANRWVYTHRVTECQYVHFGSIIGDPIGPDGDRVTLEISRFIDQSTWAGLRLSYARKGEPTVEDRFVGEHPTSFPSGVVERRGEAMAELTRDFDRFWVDVKLSVSRRWNESHRPGSSSTALGLKLGVGIRCLSFERREL